MVLQRASCRVALGGGGGGGSCNGCDPLERQLLLHGEEGDYL